MKKEKGISLMGLLLIIIFIVIIGVVCINFIVNNDKNHNMVVQNNSETYTTLELNVINQEQNNTVETNNIVEEKADYEIIDQNQMLDWDSISVKGKGFLTKEDIWSYDELVDNFAASFEDKASSIINKYPNSVYEDRVYFSKLDEDGKADSLTDVTMCYDSEKDIITAFDLDIYTADEFYLNDIQLAGLKTFEIKEKLGEPYARINIDTNSPSMIYRYNDGYILINVLMKTRYIQIVRNDYVDSIPKINKFVEKIQ